jgi:hypothetical protein
VTSAHYGEHGDGFHVIKVAIHQVAAADTHCEIVVRTEAHITAERR